MTRRRTTWLTALAGILLAAALAAVYHDRGPAAPADAPVVPAAPAAADTEQVHQVCAACHAYPPPNSFPRSAWRREVKQAYDFLRDSTLRLDYPPLEAVARYYEERAPEELPPLAPTPPTSQPVAWKRRGLRPPGPEAQPGVCNVTLAHLSDPRKLDLLVCDAWANAVYALNPYQDSPAWDLLGKVQAPAHAEVVDLDGDGVLDVLVASLGNFYPTDDPVGGVVWLRGSRDGRFTPVRLLQGVGRVADVRAADFRGTGRKDLVVGVFGSRNTGEVLFLENQTTDWSRPRFEPRVLDDRHGTVHVPVADLNGDGKPDFVALISQEHETAVAFLNEGSGKFRKETIYTAPHPAYGSSGIQLVDLDGDGDLDVLYTNGDILDAPYVLKPYHGVQWLENRGRFPFVHHPLAAMYGAMRAVAADFTGKGRKDVIAVGFLPPEEFPQRARLRPDSVLLLEQTARGKFVRHLLEAEDCDHVTCAAGAWDGDGRVHLAVGSFGLTRVSAGKDPLVLWKNLGPERSAGRR